MSLCFIFSPDSREVFTCLLKTVVGQSHNIRMSVTKISHCKFAKISRRQVCDTHTNGAQQSHDTLGKYFGEKICIKFLNMFKKVQVGKDQEKAQSEKDSHSKNQGGKKPN